MLGRQVLLFSIVIFGLHSTYAGVLECVRSANGPFEKVNKILARGTSEEEPEANIAVAGKILKESEKLDHGVRAVLEALTTLGDFRKNEAKCDEANIQRIFDTSDLIRFALKNAGSSKSELRQCEGRAQRLINQLYDEAFEACVEVLSGRMKVTDQESPDFHTGIELTRNFKRFALDKDVISLLDIKRDFIQRNHDIMREIYLDAHTGPTWLKVLLDSVDLYGRQKLQQECKDLSPNEMNKCVGEHLLTFLRNHSCSVLKGDSDIQRTFRLTRMLSKSVDRDLLDGNSAVKVEELRKLAELVVGYDICNSAIRIDPETLVDRFQRLCERHSMDLKV